MFKIKIWLIILSLVLILLDKYSWISRVRDNTVMYIQQYTSSIENHVIFYYKLIKQQNIQQHQLEAENFSLKKQIEKVNILLAEKENVAEDNKQLKQLNNINNINAFNVVIAKVIIDVNYLINNKILIDKGIVNGVTLGDAVINQEGLVGQVISVNQNNAQVMLITNQSYKIYLQNNTSKSKMLAQGIEKNHIIVKYINKNDKNAVGDLLTTTGLDNIYPANIAVAKIIRLFDENNGFNAAICEPVAHLNELKYVSILRSKYQKN